jgi:hypothetical protein
MSRKAKVFDHFAYVSLRTWKVISADHIYSLSEKWTDSTKARYTMSGRISRRYNVARGLFYATCRKTSVLWANPSHSKTVKYLSFSWNDFPYSFFNGELRPNELLACQAAPNLGKDEVFAYRTTIIETYDYRLRITLHDRNQSRNYINKRFGRIISRRTYYSYKTQGIRGKWKG